MIKSKKKCENWKKVGSNFQIFDEKFDSNVIQIWIWENFKFKPNSFEFEFEKVFKLDSNLNPIWVPFVTRS